MADKHPPSLCPLNTSVPIVAQGIIPVSNKDIATIPTITYSIPDFEGQAILRVFSNSTQSQVACFSATLTNGASFKHPTAIGSVLRIFTIIAVVFSITTAVYRSNISSIRTYYAHSVSVFVVFSVFYHIFFTGASSMN